MRYKGVPIDDISAFNTPKLYLELVALLLRDGLTWLKTLVVKRGVYLILALVTWLVVAKISIFEVPNTPSRPSTASFYSASIGLYLE